ncbi:MAG: putative endolysin [Prokaryotic dsDNA virus sp.]|nr:MAG: putative endolysin [Prokaryotic dsDNA virus sp.]|tara:strand:- start:1544 stop:2203 length:660 start_codon:yes stop_codon:yes gene_type:complete
MRTSDAGIIALIGHEGVVPAPYLDSVGVPTYGVGHTAAAGAPDPDKLPLGMPDDLDAALVHVFEVFKRDLERYEASVAAAIKVPVSQHEFDAAVSFHFNTGAIARASWVKSLNNGDREAASEQIMNWSKPQEIIPRRQSEQKLFEHGIYPKEGVTVWTVGDNRKIKWVPAARLDPKEAMDLMRGTGPKDVSAVIEPKKSSGGLFSIIASIISNIFGGKK